MSNQTKKNFIGGRDLINIGIFTAIIFIITMAVVAANVIHLLDQPYKALAELNRVCKTGGKLIIPTYVNKEKTGKTGGVVNVIGKAGADFKQQFTYSNYRAFFEKAGYRDIKTTLIQGRVPCAVAIIIK